jgi:predicted TIM-barrel fold metal-dependent hydrolase
MRSFPKETADLQEENTMERRWGRREVIKMVSTIAATVSLPLPLAAQQVKWSAGTEPAKLRAPANAADCHHHIYDGRYPVDPKAALRPGDAAVEDYRALQRRIGTTRHVIVQPSTYGTDNACTLNALAAFGAEARAVAVVNDNVADAELKRMDALGVRGIRFNLAQAGATTPAMIEPLSKRVNELGWHIQINATASTIMSIMDTLDRVPCPIVFDHLAHVPQPAGINDPLYARVRALIDKGKTWVKLSGAYQDTKIGPPTYADATAVARAYVKAAPERMVWGSDWPHPSEQQTKPDDALLFDLLAEWAPQEAVRNRILVQNAEALYGFPKTA